MKYIARYAQFVIKVFSGCRLLLHAVAIGATFVLVWTGLDWAYLVYVLAQVPTPLLFIADFLGFAVPILVPLLFFILAIAFRQPLYRLYTEATLYAVLLGLTLSTAIKTFTGRTSPPHFHHGEEQALVDNSHAFNFGFLNESVIGGWPSSHATITFAFAVTLTILLPPRWYIRASLFVLALFIGIGVTFGFHWLSEFVAGACLGTAIGLVVGGYYKKFSH